MPQIIGTYYLQSAIGYLKSLSFSSTVKIAQFSGESWDNVVSIFNQLKQLSQLSTVLALP